MNSDGIWRKDIGASVDEPSQAIINEYLPGQGISAHIDHPMLFHDPIVSLSLGSPCVMMFSKEDLKIPVLLPQRSLVILSGDSRWKWKHCIPARKFDEFAGRKIVRNRRVSVTFRSVKKKA